MKTIQNKKTKVVMRVSDKEAALMVSAKRSGWRYVPKYMWKAFVRTTAEA